MQQVPQPSRQASNHRTNRPSQTGLPAAFAVGLLEALPVLPLAALPVQQLSFQLGLSIRRTSRRLALQLSPRAQPELPPGRRPEPLQERQAELLAALN